MQPIKSAIPISISLDNHCKNKRTFLHLESVSRHVACSVSQELALDATAEEDETFEILQGEFLHVRKTIC